MCNNKRKARCILETISTTGNHLIKGDIYTIEDHPDERDTVNVVDKCGRSQGYWYRHRFEDIPKVCARPGKDYVCVDNDTCQPILTVGKTYRLQPSRFSGAKFLEPTGGDMFDDGARSGGMYAHRFVLAEDYCAPATEKENNGEFIIWSPDSSDAPKLRYYSYKQARFVARQMVEKHGGEFIVFRAEARYTKTCKVNKEEL